MSLRQHVRDWVLGEARQACPQLLVDAWDRCGVAVAVKSLRPVANRPHWYEGAVVARLVGEGADELPGLELWERLRGPHALAPAEGRALAQLRLTEVRELVAERGAEQHLEFALEMRSA